MAPKLQFYINFDEDLDYTFFRLTNIEPAGLQNRLRSRNFDGKFIENFQKAGSDKNKLEILNNYLTGYYKRNRSDMQKRIKEYQDIWKIKSRPFFETINKTVEPFNWKFDMYKFRISSFYSRASWGKGNTLAVKWDRDPKRYYFLNAYELSLTHFFEVVDQVYPQRPISDWKLWALAESTAYIFIYKDELIKNSLLPALTEPQHFGYPQLLKPIHNLNEIFIKREGFEDYVRKGIDYIRGFDEKELTTPHR